MYLHLGNDTVIESQNVVGIFDLETSSISKYTRELLKTCQQKNRIINVTYELPKSFILYNYAGEISLYISQISTATLMKRMSQKRSSI